MQKILGIVARGHRNARVVFLADKFYWSGVIPRDFVPTWSFPLNQVRSRRKATDRDKRPILEQVVLENPIRVCANHTRFRASLFGDRRVTVILLNGAGSPGQTVETERRFLAP
jgi:hypothetical protein